MHGSALGVMQGGRKMVEVRTAFDFQIQLLAFPRQQQVLRYLDTDSFLALHTKSVEK